MRFKDVTLNKRINITMAVLISAVFLILGYVIFDTQEAELKKDTHERMLTHLDDLYLLLDNHVKEKQLTVTTTIELAYAVMLQQGDLYVSDETLEIDAFDVKQKAYKKVYLPVILQDKNPLYKNNTLVDELKKKSVDVASVFQFVDGGFVRVSTNVIDKNGNSAIGTFLEPDSEIVKTLNRGEMYYGRSNLYGESYITAYKPVYVENELQAAVAVGVKEMNYGMLKKAFSNKRYFKSGYPYLVKADGTLLIHPNAENENIASTSFFQQMGSTGSETNHSRYKWPDNSSGKWKQQYFRYFQPYDSFICVSLYEDDMYLNIANLFKRILLGFSASLVILFIGLTVLIRPVVKGIKKIALLANEISNGNLRVSIDMDSKDELGNTADSLRLMVAKLKEIIKTIDDGAKNIVAGSSEVSASSQQLSQGANEQASSTEEVSASMQQMASNIQQSTQNSVQSEHISERLLDEISRVKESSMLAIAANRSIGDNIQIVNDIAFQTNILALNAAVEAARAGEQGRGFAVVASEVRKLAENSKNAAEQIIKLVEQSIQSNEEAGKYLLDTIPHVEKIAALVQKAAAANQEQSKGAELINSAILGVSSVAQQSAATSEELASNAQEMNSQAEQLKGIVSFFQIDESARNGNNYNSAKTVSLENESENVEIEAFRTEDFESKQSEAEYEKL